MENSNQNLSQDQSLIGPVTVIVIAVGTLILWNIPYGNYVLYPFSILGTWFHEMGHGLTAILVGGSFEKLEIYSNGSGLAFNRIPVNRFASALVSAGGLMGPAVIGSLFIVISRYQKLSKFVLILFAIVLILSGLIWVRTIVGIGMIILISGFCLLIALKSTIRWQHATIVLIGIQAIISTYRQLDYLYTKKAEINGKTMLSDTGKIAENLFLPYWFWGTLIAVISAILIFLSIKFAFKERK